MEDDDVHESRMLLAIGRVGRGAGGAEAEGEEEGLSSVKRVC